MEHLDSIAWQARQRRQQRVAVVVVVVVVVIVVVVDVVVVVANILPLTYRKHCTVSQVIQVDRC